MQRIQELPDHVIAKIAAGEVIERPVYAVKELVENSIDAQAKNIYVVVEESGLTKINITDDGEGMSRQDILICFKQHTTSKITSNHNLNGIKSLGFRGEALSSICSISDVTIRSRTIDDIAGTEVVINKGELKEVNSVGMPVGTNITIENLFSNLPARKKFLKHPRTEFRHIMEVILYFSIAYPNIHFQLIHNSKIIFDFPIVTGINNRFPQLLGSDIFSELLPFENENAGVKINGFISKPQMTTSKQTKQFIFINNRIISDKYISANVKEAYGSIIHKDDYPIFVLFIYIPHEMVDVNVHPRKEQVALYNEKSIYKLIQDTIASLLKNKSLMYTKTDWSRLFGQKMPNYASSVLKDSVLGQESNYLGKILKNSDTLQIHKVYITIQTFNGIFLIDQHAAHERIMFEKFSAAFHKEKTNRKLYELPEPKIFHLSSTLSEVIEDKIDVLKRLGFVIEDFGSNTKQVTHIPLFYKDHNLESFLDEILESHTTEQGKIENLIDTQSASMLKYLACRSAFKAGDSLTKKQIKKLLEDLESTPNNLTCPHGRPTKIELSLRDINKLFRR